MNKSLILKLVCCFVWFLALTGFSQSVCLWENGKVNAEIVVGASPSGVVQFAAAELSELLGVAAGKPIQVKAESSAPVRIYLGATPQAQKAGLVPQGNENIIAVKPDGSIFLLGNDDSQPGPLSVRTLLFEIEKKGTLETVYTFLEKYAGARFIMPGKNGASIARQSRLAIPATTERIKPSFAERRTWLFRPTELAYATSKELKEFGSLEDIFRWGLRLRYTSIFNCRVFGCHTPAYLWLHKTLFPKHPEYFALQADGTRSDKDMCWSSTDVRKFWVAVAECWFRGDPNPRAAGLDLDKWNNNLFRDRNEFMLDPHDYMAYGCKCDKCQQYEKKYGANGRGEVLYEAIFYVANEIKKKFPGKVITTLVYPPKNFFPADKKIPGNVRVRITYPWTTIIPGSSVLKQTVELTKKWQSNTKYGVSLWLYLSSAFGNSFYGVPEVAASSMQNLLKAAQPYTEGVFFEHIESSFTICGYDQYAISHLLYDTNCDLKQLRKEYCQRAFGPAAQEMESFLAILEEKWLQVAKLNSDGLITNVSKPSPLLKTIFDTIYNYQELCKLDDLLKKAAAKTKINSPEAARISRYQRYVLDIAKGEFSLHSSDKVNRFKPESFLCVRKITGAPTEKEWSQVPTIPMVSANAGDLTVKSSFKVLSSGNNFYLRAIMEEPKLADSTTQDRKAGEYSGIWNDNVFELFFADKADNVTQILINDRGFYCVHRLKEKAYSCDLPGMSVTTKATPTGFQADVVIPASVVGNNFDDCRFNITRTRNITGLPREYATWSPECKVGRWTTAACYGRLALLTPKKAKPEFSGAAKPESAATVKGHVLRPAYTRSAKNIWRTWNPPRSKAILGEDPLHGYQGKPSRFIDFTKEAPTGKEFPPSWRCIFPVEKFRGATLRVSVYLRAETTNPDAYLKLQVNWNDKATRWYKGQKHPYGGEAAVKLLDSDWRKVTLEIPVPTVSEIYYCSISFVGENIRPGKIWFDALKVEELAQ